MSISKQLDLDLHAIPIEVFDLIDDNLTIDSLTTGHGMAENGASLCGQCCACSCWNPASVNSWIPG